jgi:hypothetical protein
VNWVDLAGGLVGFLLTISIFSYFLGDNWLFRLAVHIFIGVTAGLVVVIVWYNLLWPKLIQPFTADTPERQVFLIITILSSLLLLAKISPRISFLGNPVMAVLVGVGAAVAVGGALLGTIFPLVSSQIISFDFVESGIFSGNTVIKLVNSVIILVGTITTLLFFHSRSRNQPGSKGWFYTVNSVGKMFLAVTFGALFAGILAAALAAFLERMDFVLNFVKMVFRGGG